MKKIISLLLCTTLLCACFEDVGTDNKGSIAGTVLDYTVGAPIPVVNVVLKEGNISTVTGYDGTFWFNNIPEGEYTIEISKNGYKPGEKKVYVNAGETSEFQLLLERIPAIVTTDRDTLDFGKSYNTMSFNIVNSSYEDMEWSVEENCKWITEVKPKSGVLKFGGSETIVIVIDRELLDGGINRANIVLRSTNGSTEVKVVAEGEYKTVPSVETYEVTNFSAHSATLNGEITNSGSPEYTERGFVYSTEKEPTIEKCIARKTSPKNSNTEFSCDIKELTQNKKYYVRAYAMNENGVSYGRVVEFTTTEGCPTVETLNAKNVNASSATIGGRLIENGGDEVFERGVCWDTEGTPDIDDNHKYINGDETGEYWIDVDGLKTNTKYFARAYAKNENGVSYGRIIEFTTVAGLPTVESLYAKNITAHSASLGGQLISNGGYNVYERGVCWDTDGTPNIDDNHKYISGDETGEYWIDVNGLTPNKKYYACAYAKNENGISYGKLYDFTTTSSKVNVVIENPTDVTANSALLVATIKDAGSPAYTECGFCYSTQHEPTIYDNKVKVSFSGSGRYEQTVSGLDYNTVYYVRAYAMQNGEAVYSESEVNFKTVYSSATVSLVEITDVDETTATLKGNVTNVGSPNYTERGFCWSNNSENPTIDMDYMRVSGTTKGTFKYEMNGLSKGTTYHVRAYVIQAGEVKYSNKMEFSTIRKPKVSTKNVTDIKSNGSWSLTYSATFNGNVGDAGSPAYVERGFVYSTYSSPTVGSGTKVTVSGSGKTGSFSASVSELSNYQKYYVRAYVKTKNEYIYGETVSFSTY